MIEQDASGKVGAQSNTEYDYFLEELRIINSHGLTIDLDNVFEEVNIYEDIFSNALSGDIILNDSASIINRLQIHGNEFLSISFRTPSLNKYEKVFRIYKISELTMRNTSNMSYKIHFCSEEFFLNQQYSISKSFKETRLSDIVKIIARNFLKISDRKFPDSAIEQSTILSGAQTNPIIVPNLRPFDAINWVSSFALSRFDLSPGFFFYENCNGFNFRSFSDLYAAPSKKTLFYAPKNANQDETVGSKHNKLDQIEFKQVFDTLDGINNGAFGSKITKIDFLNRSSETERFSLNETKYKTLNQFLPFNNAKNRLGNSINESSSFEKMFPKFQGDLVSQWLLVRASRLALLNSTKLHIDIPGDSSISAGDVVTILVPENSSQTDSSQIKPDMMMSGNYLITGLRHQLLGVKYFCHAQICKDSVNYNLNYTPQYNAGWNLVINS